MNLREHIVQVAARFPEKREELLALLNVRADPSFVPHEEWADKIWLIPQKATQEPWYYAAPRTHSPADIDNPDFLESVDEPMRPLVEWLHKRGVQTGPSCAGHRISPEGFRTIWEGLCSDAERIRGAGLPLKDIENDDLYVMRNQGYELPWADFREFLSQASAHQPIGYLPFSTKDLRGEFLVGKWPGYEIMNPEYGEYRVKTDSPDPKVWEEIADQLTYWLE